MPNNDSCPNCTPDKICPRCYAMNGVDASQVKLFEEDEWWEEPWQGMPEFKQDDLEPFKSILVHFATREDLAAFAELVGQNIGGKTQSIWHPKQEIAHFTDKAYVDFPGEREE